MKHTEKELAAFVVKYFQEKGYEVFQEVKLGDRFVDLVVRHEDRVACIEVKKHMSLELLHQGMSCQGHAHEVYIAVPHGRHDEVKQTGFRLADQLGLGVFKILASGQVRLYLEPQQCQDPLLSWIQGSFLEKTKDYCGAGSSGAKRWTPWKQFCADLVQEVRRRTGEHTELQDAVRSVKYPNTNAVAAMRSIERGIRSGLIPELEVYLHNNRKHIRTTP